MENEKILAKLEKLLALAGSSNEHEASRAMEKAIKISVENNIELSRVSQSSRQEIIKEMLDNQTSRLSVTHRFVSDIIRAFFEVKIITAGTRLSGRRLYFIGRKDKIDFAKFLNQYLTNTFFTLWKNFYKENPHVTVSTARESYFLGLWQGLTKKLKEAKKAAEQAIEKDIKQNYSLVLANSAEELNKALVNFFPDCKTTKGKVINVKSDNALNNGFKDGQEINVYAGLENNKIPVLA